MKEKVMKLEFSHPSPRKPIMGPGAKTRPRPLGSVRLSNSIDSVPKFPPLTNGKTPRMEATYEGISGNKMTVPPPKSVSSETTPSRAESKYSDRTSTLLHRTMSPVPRQQENSSRSSRSACSCNHAIELAQKEQGLKDSMTREHQLKQHHVELQKIIDELRQQIWEKDKTIEDLKKQFERQEEQYKELYSQECVKHESTRQTLQETTYDLEQKVTQIEELTDRYEQKLLNLTTEMDNKLSQERAEKQREISIRDEKLGKLKKQMADALKGNSWERQQQLDELSKELQRVQEESELLKMRLKAMSKGAQSGGGHKSGGCLNCDVMRKQLSAAQNVIKERETSIVELKALCTRFEKQLGQQDSLLLQFAEAKGYKPADNIKKK